MHGAVAWEHWGSVLTVVCGTSDLGARLPDDLGGMAPLVEVGHAWAGLAVVGSWEIHDLVVVPLVRDGVGSEVSWALRLLVLRLGSSGHGDVLSVTASAWSAAQGLA